MKGLERDHALESAKRLLEKDPFPLDMEVLNPSDEDLIRMSEALRQAAEDPDTNDFDTLIMCAANGLSRNELLPEWLAAFAADVLKGERKRPTRRGPDKYKNWLRDYKFWRATQAVACMYDLPHYTNNELSDKTTAAEIVALAAGCNTDVVVTAYKKFKKIG